MLSDHPFIIGIEEATANRPILRLVKGLVAAHVIYPAAEYLQKRSVRPKFRELRKHYKMPFHQRRDIALNRLVNILEFASAHVPYYQDLFKSIHFNIENIKKDVNYLKEIPCLTKDIIREQGDRMLSDQLSKVRHHQCKTGGSTGLSAVIYYDQAGADYSSAVTLFGRERVGNGKHHSELHFACRFPDADRPAKFTRGDYQCLAMNRSNIFFDHIDDAGLEEIWKTLQARKPFMVHAHPSTIYALACYIEKKYGSGKAFTVFESSGELLESYMREKIAQALQCRVVDRYGLAELGVMAYELNADGLQVMDSEGWAESEPSTFFEGYEELIFTGFRNKLMPLIRYRTGDLATVIEKKEGFFLDNLMGRIHDVVNIKGVAHATHYIQDVLDHRVRGIQEFQIDVRSETHPILRLVLEPSANQEETLRKLQDYWQDAFDYQFVGHDAFIRVGTRSKFRHVVTK